MEEAGTLMLEVTEGFTASLGANHAETLQTKGTYAGMLNSQS